MDKKISLNVLPAVEHSQANQHYRRAKLPVPQPRSFDYRFNRLLALASSPRRLINYIRYSRAKRGANLNYLPIKLDVEPASRCNFRCTMCQVSDWPKGRRAGDQSLEDFKQLIDSQYGLFEIKIQGLGEPLLAGDAFFEMIRYARSKHIWVRTTTNGSLLHLKDNYKKLIDSGINEVQISFDGASKETYEKIRRGSKFEHVVRNCKLINEYCNSRNLMRMRMWVLVQKYNVHEFFNFIPLAHEMGFKRLTYSLNVLGWGLDNWIAENRSITVEDAITPEIAHEAIERGRQVGLEVTFWNVTSRFSTKSPERLCPWPFERAFVSSDQRIVPCCMISNPDVFELGDARDFKTQWHGEAYQEFRRAHLEGRLPKICKTCYESSEEH